MPWDQRDWKVLWHPFTQQQEWEALPMTVIERGEGVELIDSEGRRYLDGVSSLWCNLHGHGHPRLLAALQQQATQLCHSTLLGLSHPPAIQLAEALLRYVPHMQRVFYSDSGSTSTEVALKMAFQACQQRGESRRVRFAALAEAYHGDTLGAVSVGGIDLFHHVYRPLLFDALRIPCPDRPDPAWEARCLDQAAALFAQHGQELAAFIFEPLVQGAAGMRMHSPAFLQQLCQMAREAGTYLVADEVATGFGRTGTMFAIDQAGIQPDFLCMAKGITGGYLPLAATLCTEAVFDCFRGPYTAWKTLFHGHTYTGNPLACAVALASLEIFEEEQVLQGLPQKIQALSRALADLQHPAIVERRQKGLMAAICLSGQDAPFPTADRMGMKVCYACREQGLILRNLGDAVILMPPLSMSAAQLQDCVHRLERALYQVLPV